MTTDWRALCVELLDCLEKADWPHKQKHVFQQWIYIARRALAEPDGPAVSDDREPVSDHPITPSPELVQQWLGEFFGCNVSGELSDSERYLATQAANWGYQQAIEELKTFLRNQQ